MKPISGPHKNGKTLNGMLVFAAQRELESEYFRLSCRGVCWAFTKLCNIYSLSLESVAIFHKQFGQTHAFNSRGSMYFNVRNFASLDKRYHSEYRVVLLLVHQHGSWNSSLHQHASRSKAQIFYWTGRLRVPPQIYARYQSGTGYHRWVEAANLYIMSRRWES